MRYQDLEAAEDLLEQAVDAQSGHLTLARVGEDRRESQVASQPLSSFFELKEWFHGAVRRTRPGYDGVKLRLRLWNGENRPVRGVTFKAWEDREPTAETEESASTHASTALPVVRGDDTAAQVHPTEGALTGGRVVEASPSLRPNTAIRYARALDLFLRHLEQVHGKGAPLPPYLLTRRLLAEWHAALKHDGLHGRPRQDATRRKLVEVVQLAWAWLYDNDESGALIPPPRKIRMLREPAAPTVAPTWTEMDACIDALRSWQRDLAVLLRFTGLRVQQAMYLTWDDVDLGARCMRVRGELGKSPQERRGRVVLPLRAVVDLIPPVASITARKLLELEDRDQPRFEGLDPNDPRPIREITLDDVRRDDWIARCPIRVPRRRKRRGNVVFIDTWRKIGGGGGSRSQYANAASPGIRADHRGLPGQEGEEGYLWDRVVSPLQRTRVRRPLPHRASA